MEQQGFRVHPTLVLMVVITLGVSQIVSNAGAGNTAGGTDVPPEGGFANQLPGASTGPTTGEPDDSKTTKGIVEDRMKSEPANTTHDSTSPRKSPSSSIRIRVLTPWIPITRKASIKKAIKRTLCR